MSLHALHALTLCSLHALHAVHVPLAGWPARWLRAPAGTPYLLTQPANSAEPRQSLAGESHSQPRVMEQTSWTTSCSCSRSSPPKSRYNNLVSIFWNAFLSWLCVGGGELGMLGGLAGADDAAAAAAASGQDWLAALPCVQKQLHLAGAGVAAGLPAAPLSLLEEARQASVIERIIEAWSWQARGLGAGAALRPGSRPGRAAVQRQEAGACGWRGKTGGLRSKAPAAARCAACAEGTPQRCPLLHAMVPAGLWGRRDERGAGIALPGH